MGKMTIKDIADRTGVSISTVSRVINGNYPVSKEVRERVQQAISESEYRPNANARSLRSNRTNLIALVVADLSNHFFMEIAKGLEMEIAKMGYQMVIASSGGEVEKEHALIDTLVDRRIDGLVIATADSENKKIQYCLSQGIPVVLIDRVIKGLKVNRICWNDYESSYDLTNILISHGHRKIAIINVMLSNPNGASRLRGFKQALEDAGIPASQAVISPSNFSKEQACRFVKEMMRREEHPTAIYCANNIMLDGTLQALQELGLHIYEDVSVVVFGNPECNRYITPQITAAEQDSLEMGRQAGEILKKVLIGKQSYLAQVVLNSQIVERGSVKTIE